jgi:antitoxin HicB
MKVRYSMVIQWSDEDQAFIVSLPEFGPYCKTHGDTYEEAIKQGQDALESLIDAYRADKRPLPKPIQFGSPLPVV